MSRAQDDWWIIAGAAVALHGEGPDKVSDVDVLTSVRDAHHILGELGIDAVPDAHHALFRSEVYGRWCGPSLTVEFMAGFQVFSGSEWIAIAPTTRERIVVDGMSVYIPSRGELKLMLVRFGRPKDLERMRLL